MQAKYVFRELREPNCIANLLRTRHHAFFEDQRCGPLRPLGLDLSAHDQRAQLFGVLRGSELVGGLRIVFRSDQPIAAIVRSMRAVAVDAVGEPPALSLPSERAFDLAPHLGSLCKLVDAEVGRVVLVRDRACRGLLRELLIAGLAALHLARVRLYLFSCASDNFAKFAAITNPRWRIETCRAGGIEHGFDFPRKTYAAVAAVHESPWFERALAYADELAANESLQLSVGSAVASPGDAP